MKYFEKLLLNSLYFITYLYLHHGEFINLEHCFLKNYPCGEFTNIFPGCPVNILPKNFIETFWWSSRLRHSNGLGLRDPTSVKGFCLTSGQNLTYTMIKIG